MVDNRNYLATRSSNPFLFHLGVIISIRAGLRIPFTARRCQITKMALEDLALEILADFSMSELNDVVMALVNQVNQLTEQNAQFSRGECSMSEQAKKPGSRVGIFFARSEEECRH